MAFDLQFQRPPQGSNTSVATEPCPMHSAEVVGDTFGVPSSSLLDLHGEAEWSRGSSTHSLMPDGFFLQAGSIEGRRSRGPQKNHFSKTTPGPPWGREQATLPGDPAAASLSSWGRLLECGMSCSDEAQTPALWGLRPRAHGQLCCPESPPPTAGPKLGRWTTSTPCLTLDGGASGPDTPGSV